MKKSFFKKIMILCFAVFGMVMIGNNVFADPNDGEDPGDGDSGGGLITCYTESVSISGYYTHCLGCKSQRGTAKWSTRSRCSR